MSEGEGIIKYRVKGFGKITKKKDANGTETRKWLVIISTEKPEPPRLKGWVLSVNLDNK